MAKKAQEGADDSNPRPEVRDGKGKFAKGTRGRPKGARTKHKLLLEGICRRVLAQPGKKSGVTLVEEQLTRIIKGENERAAIEAMKFAADRGYGKAPLVVRHGLDPESPEGILLSLSGQPLPGGGMEDGDEEE